MEITKHNKIIYFVAFTFLLLCTLLLSACGGVKPENISNINQLLTDYSSDVKNFLDSNIQDKVVKYSFDEYNQSNLLSMTYDFIDTSKNELKTINAFFVYEENNTCYIKINKVEFSAPLSMGKIARYEEFKDDIIKECEALTITNIYSCQYNVADKMQNEILAEGINKKVFNSLESNEFAMVFDREAYYTLVPTSSKMYLCNVYDLYIIKDDSIEVYQVAVNQKNSQTQMIENLDTEYRYRSTLVETQTLSAPFVTKQYAGSNVSSNITQKFDENEHWFEDKQGNVISQKQKHSVINNKCEVCGYEFEYTYGLQFKLNSEKNGYILTGFDYNYKTNKIVIPESYMGLPVVEIGENCFYNNSLLQTNYITTIVIPKSIKTIDYMAFDYQNKIIEVYNLSSLDIQAGASDNGGVAKNAKYVYNNINTPSKVTVSDDFILYADGEEKYVLGYNGNKSSITLPDGYDIYGYAFYYNDIVKDVTFSDTTKYIGDYAFYEVELDNIELPKNLVTLGSFVFNNCASLKTITLPATLKNISADSIEVPNLEAYYVEDSSVDFYAQEGVLYNCEKTEIIDVPNCVKGEITIPESVTEIAAGQFKDRDFITKVTVPEGITQINDETFRSCNSLKEVVLPNTLTHIGEMAFSNCIDLNKINFPENLLTIDGLAFNNCKSLVEINLPDTITNLGVGAFYGCDNLTKINIPSPVTTLPKNLFYECYSLSEIQFNNNVTSIGEDAFYSCDSLTVLHLPDSLVTIEDDAFCRCDSLTTIVFTLNSNLQYTGQNSFSYCENLTKVVIPKSLKSISATTFFNYSMITIYYQGNLAEWENVHVDVNNFNDNELENIHFYSETQPAEEGNYWHYVDGLPVAW